jgi:adhesin/invasin
LGEVLPAVVEGIGAPGPPNLANTVNTVTATIGTVDAKVLFSGLTPGFVGLYQVNMIMPTGVAPGNAVPLVLTVAGNSSLPVTLAVR